MTVEAQVKTLEIYESHDRAFRFNFNLFREDHKHAGATSEFEDVEGTRYFLSDDFDSGYAIRENGELVFVFSRKPGRGDELVASAVENGAYRLDCFDGYLPSLYARHGFVEHDREENWTPGGPDVVYMYVPCSDHYYDAGLKETVCPNTHLTIEDEEFDPTDFGYTHENMPVVVDYCKRLPQNFA